MALDFPSWVWVALFVLVALTIGFAIWHGKQINVATPEGGTITVGPPPVPPKPDRTSVARDATFVGSKIRSITGKTGAPQTSKGNVDVMKRASVENTQIDGIHGVIYAQTKGEPKPEEEPKPEGEPKP